MCVWVMRMCVWMFVLCMWVFEECVCDARMCVGGCFRECVCMFGGMCGW